MIIIPGKKHTLNEKYGKQQICFFKVYLMGLTIKIYNILLKTFV